MTASFKDSRAIAPTAIRYSLPSVAATCLDRARVYALEQAIRAELPPVEMPVENHFSHGVYGRELFIPAGTVLTGQIHKLENMNVLLEGEMLVLTDQGPKRVRAGYVEVSPPGTKRAALTLTDCRWLTIHGTHETDVDVIETEFIAHTEQEYQAFCKQLETEGGKLWLGQQ